MSLLLLCTTQPVDHLAAAGTATERHATPASRIVHRPSTVLFAPKPCPDPPTKFSCDRCAVRIDRSNACVARDGDPLRLPARAATKC
ncbi:hypothetical protein M433DRAFT_151801 [Acidomyces richmondensis BFW]|nr:MAG: hypothetical protein FE78DRAFT_86299 [Acidomyces sp. 'richmondensis']KYG47789.1 hypothetical protein M433DRAFT_151801 [Acidomyces richmondensis BFW]